MTHLHPGGETATPPPLATFRDAPAASYRRSHAGLGIDHHLIRSTIAERRAALALLETEMVGRCEEAAARIAPRTVQTDDRGTWDRAMWDRYLAAAATLEPDYLPRILRLHAEIERLERLLLLPPAREARAA